MSLFTSFTMTSINILASLFVFIIGVFALILSVMFCNRCDANCRCRAAELPVDWSLPPYLYDTR